MKLPTTSLIVYPLVYSIILSLSISLHFLLLSWISSSLLRLYIIDFYVTCVLFYIGNFIYSSNNIYDIHWPLIPWISSMYFYFLSNLTELPLKKFLLLILLISFWSSHLIWQTITSATDIKHEDWRYQMMRGQYKKNFVLFAFFALHLLPMFEVLIGSSSIYYICINTNSYEHFTIGDILSLFIIACGIVLENIADRQLAEFRRHRKRSREHRFAVLSNGLWKYSRHPNYLGEMLFWWGLFLMGRVYHAPWWCAIGPLLITLMMIFGSIPISEERLFRKYPEYKFFQRRIPILIPTFGLLG
ncbi:hypothetical protein I4U23_030501 [Adineta vaga]|nr:hypothetical protein I4U23_030501 [Adineta vaga]